MVTRYGLGLAALAASMVAACADAPPPRGEAVVVVTTDMVVGPLASELRIEVFDEEGRPLLVETLTRPDARDWPVSFSVYTQKKEAVSWLRLRLSPEGSDAAPLVTIDRLVGLRLREGVRGRVVIPLHAACGGTPVRLDGAAFLAAETCEDRGGERSPPRVLEAEPESFDLVPPSLPALASSCEDITFPGGQADGVSCIVGGPTILGTSETLPGLGSSHRPERLVLLSTFFLDRDEVTVGRFRRALAEGFSPPFLPEANGGALEKSLAENGCTWTEQADFREGYPLNCVSRETALAFCSFVGGRLPTHAQWERAARRGDVDAASRGGRSRYPWGNAEPTCTRAVFGRFPEFPVPGHCELETSAGLEPGRSASGDLSPDGVYDLAGSLEEWVLDRSALYDHPCWSEGASRDPLCTPDEMGADDAHPPWGTRGGSWAGDLSRLPATRRRFLRDGILATVGFRCAYPAEPFP